MIPHDPYCAQCRRRIERSAKWWAAQPAGPVCCSGACRSRQRLDDLEGDARQRTAEAILSHDETKGR
jgi:hypothetical protein